MVSEIVVGDNHTFAGLLEGNTDYYWCVRGLNMDNNGLWSEYGTFTAEVATMTEKYDQQPRKYRLNQNYPNPFNPPIQISSELPEAGAVKLNIYNFL